MHPIRRRAIYKTVGWSQNRSSKQEDNITRKRRSSDGMNGLQSGSWESDDSNKQKRSSSDGWIRFRCKEHEGSRPPPRHKKTYLSNPGQIILGLVALLDFLSTVANRRLFTHGDRELGEDGHLRIFSQNFYLPHEIFTKIFLWLDRYSIHFGFLFSVLWCIEAFSIADRGADRALREWDRKERMNVLRRLLNPDRRASHNSIDYERFKTYAVYWASLILQFLCLPVGFYLIIYRFARMKVSSSDAAGALISPEDMQSLLVSTYEADELPGEYRTFGNETKLSLGFAIVKHSGSAVYKATNSRMKRTLWKVGWLKGRKLGWNVVRHPFKSFNNTREMMYWVRWIRYLAPLVRGLFKLRSHLRQFLVAWKQRRQKKRAMKARRQTLRKMTENQKRIRAAKIIQSTFRSYQQRQACLETMLLQRAIDDQAARRLQFALRLLCENAKANEEKKKAELARLEARNKHNVRRGRRNTIMDPKDRERMGQLRKQLTEFNTRSIDRRLLMQPDSKFLMIIKSIFIFLTVMEMAGYFMNQRLKKENSSLKAMLRDLLIPDPVIDLKECSCLAKARGDPLKWEHFRATKKKCRAEPWYCRPVCLHMQSIYTDLILFVMEQCIALLALGALLDVPIFFYTGIYHPDTEVLVPKPFLRRYIFPGLFLQLLVNPQMEPASKVFFKALKSSFQIGPIRILRWYKAFFWPATLLACDFLEWSVWARIVSFANRLPPPEPESAHAPDGAPPLRRKSSIDPKRMSIFIPTKSGVPVPPRLSFTSGRNISLSSNFAVLDDPWKSADKKVG